MSDWWARQDSNLHPSASKADALSVELRAPDAAWPGRPLLELRLRIIPSYKVEIEILEEPSVRIPGPGHTSELAQRRRTGACAVVFRGLGRTARCPRSARSTARLNQRPRLNQRRGSFAFSQLLHAPDL